MQELSAAEANRLYYASRADQYDRTEECVTLPRHRTRMRRVLSLALSAAASHERVLDACGGSGYVSLELLSMGIAPLTVDISPEMLEMYKEKAESAGFAADTCVSEIASFLSRKTERWDLIVFSSALHHLEDYQEVLGVACDCLNEGGVIATVFDPISTSGLGRSIRYLDYLVWLAAREPWNFLNRLLARIRGNDDGPSVGRVAERHALSGIDDLALAERLRLDGCEIVLHEREFDARFSVFRAALRLLSLPSAFSFVIRRPA